MSPFIVVLDVETTGVNLYDDAIVQLSAIKFFGTIELGRLNTYINPGRPIPPEVTLIHKITDDMVKDAPEIADIKAEFLEFIKDSAFVGYNIAFDLGFISMAFDGVVDEMPYFDVMHLAQDHLNLPDYRLETVAEVLGFCPKGSFHDSMTDCEATADAFWKLCTLELLNHSPIYHAPKRKKKKAFETFRPKEIVPQVTPTDINHPLYGKRIVFTGELSIDRHSAAQMAVDVGASVKSGVSGKTDYLVVGVQDPAHCGPNGMSGKEEKAYELNALGKASIEIITENEFMSLLKGGVSCG